MALLARMETVKKSLAGMGLECYLKVANEGRNQAIEAPQQNIFLPKLLPLCTSSYTLAAIVDMYSQIPPCLALKSAYFLLPLENPAPLPAIQQIIIWLLHDHHVHQMLQIINRQPETMSWFLRSLHSCTTADP